MLVFEEKKLYCDFRRYDQNDRYIYTFTVNPIDFHIFCCKFERVLLKNPTPLPLIFITDSDRAISTLY